ncbi:HlyD family efflux transporter periplasmic adaptor subunit [Calditrichota bacterium LG25]
MRKILIFGLISFFIISCEPDSRPQQNAEKRLTVWQKFELRKDTLNVDIPVEGKLVAWHKMDLLAPIDSKVISLLVEKNESIKKGDLLLHLWPLSGYRNYTPVEIFSPMNGVIAELYVKLADTLKQGEMLLTIENRENLTMRAKLNHWQTPFVKRNANVTLTYHNMQIKGAVIDVDLENDWVTIIVPNQQLKIKEELLVNGYIQLQNIAGDFLPAAVFEQRDSLLAELESETMLTIYRVGMAGDSLAFIAPSLPDINEIQVKKNLDINK